MNEKLIREAAEAKYDEWLKTRIDMKDVVGKYGIGDKAIMAKAFITGYAEALASLDECEPVEYCEWVYTPISTLDDIGQTYHIVNYKTACGRTGRPPKDMLCVCGKPIRIKEPV